MSFSTAVRLNGRNNRCWRLFFLCRQKEELCRQKKLCRQKVELCRICFNTSIFKMFCFLPDSQIRSRPNVQIDNVELRVDNDLLYRESNLGQNDNSIANLFLINYIVRLNSHISIYNVKDKISETYMFNYHLMCFHRRLRGSCDWIWTKTKTKIFRLVIINANTQCF